MNVENGYTFAVNGLRLLAVCLLGLILTGCPSTALREGGFYYGGYKATAEAIDHHAGNREVAEFVYESIDLVLERDEILFSAVETWYRDTRKEIDLPPIEMELLEQLVIVPLWDGLKEKYGGLKLDLRDEQVVRDILAFQRGMKTALGGS